MIKSPGIPGGHEPKNKFHDGDSRHYDADDDNIITEIICHLHDVNVKQLHHLDHEGETNPKADTSHGNPLHKEKEENEFITYKVQWTTSPL